MRRKPRNPRDLPHAGLDEEIPVRVLLSRPGPRPPLRDPPPDRLDAGLERDVPQDLERLEPGVEKVGEKVGKSEGPVEGDEVPDKRGVDVAHEWGEADSGGSVAGAVFDGIEDGEGGDGGEDVGGR